MNLLQRTADALAGDRTGKTDLNLDQIRLDGGTQPRAAINSETVKEYADEITRGAEFPAITVFYDGAAYWLADGFHRWHAHKLADKRSILADIRQGTQRDAVLWSLGANADHGLRRTNEDKRRAVLRMLEDTEWRELPDREIARQCKVTHPFVGKVRGELSGKGYQIPTERKVERNGKTYTQNTAPIAAANTRRAKPKPTPRPTQPTTPPAPVLEVPLRRYEPGQVQPTKLEQRRERLRATVGAAITVLGDDELRNTAAAAGVGYVYGGVINALREIAKKLSEE